MMRLAIVGCGNHSELHHAAPLAHFARERPGEIELLAACDLDVGRAERFCREYGFARPYADMATMLDTESPDAVVCVMPQPRIADVGIELLERRVPCSIEKPLGECQEDVRRIAAAAEKTGAFHMVSLNRRFAPQLNRALEWARGIGPIRFVRCTMTRHRRREASFLWGTGVHGLDALCYLAGPIEDCDARTVEGTELTSKWFDLSLRFVSGCVGSFEVLPTAGVVDETYEILGEDYRARVTMPREPEGAGARLRCWRDGELAIDETPDDDDDAFLWNGAYREVEEFVRCIRDGERPRARIEDVTPSLEIAWQILTDLSVV